MILKIFGENCPVDLPLIVGPANKTCQHHLETGAVNVWDLIQSDYLTQVCDCDYLTQVFVITWPKFFSRRKVNMKSLMKR